MNWRSTRPTKSHSGSRPTSVERDTMNHLYFGDNLDVLRRYVDDESVDLIYLDPPFNSQADYRHFSPNPTASGSKKGLDLRREGGNCPLQRLRPSVGRSKRAFLTIDCPRLTPKS